jgi:hypothetical protein
VGDHRGAGALFGGQGSSVALRLTVSAGHPAEDTPPQPGDRAVRGYVLEGDALGGLLGAGDAEELGEADAEALAEADCETELEAAAEPEADADAEGDVDGDAEADAEADGDAEAEGDAVGGAVGRGVGLGVSRPLPPSSTA